MLEVNDNLNSIQDNVTLEMEIKNNVFPLASSSPVRKKANVASFNLNPNVLSLTGQNRSHLTDENIELNILQKEKMVIIERILSILKTNGDNSFTPHQITKLYADTCFEKCESDGNKSIEVNLCIIC